MFEDREGNIWAGTPEGLTRLTPYKASQMTDIGLVAGAAQDPKSFGFDLSGTLSDATDRAIRMIERQKIADVLAQHDGHKTRAAEALDVSYKTLLTKIKEYNL